ncbi:MAG: MBL fold metallo-hydrolase [Opitutales bacterium]
MNYLEDTFADVLSKAQRGLGLTTSTLAEDSGLDPQAVRALRSGEETTQGLQPLAERLGLRPEGLRLLADERYAPPVPDVPGFHIIESPAPMAGYEEMRVNAYLLHHPESEQAILFDTGTRTERLEEAFARTGRQLTALFVTHTHWDHVEVLDALSEAHPEMAAYGPGEGDRSLFEPLEPGSQLTLGGLEIEARATPGHAPAAFSYVVRGLAVPVAVVGDALFAGSVGGIPPEAYAAGLAAVREQLFSLPDETIVAPGHGRLTTIGYERLHNPFFPGFGG